MVTADGRFQPGQAEGAYTLVREHGVGEGQARVYGVRRWPAPATSGPHKLLPVLRLHHARERVCKRPPLLARLEPTIGGYHTSRPGRPAFALDLMEPFRPLIADSLAVSSFNRGELTEGHFLRTSAGCAFTDSGRGAFFNAYGRRMEAEITHPVFGYRLSYRRMLILHARMIAAWLLGEVSTLSFLTTR